MITDFQRLATVRARRRSRRIRWAGALAVLCVASGLVTIAWLTTPRDPGSGLQGLRQQVAALHSAGGRADDAQAEALGRVKTVDTETGIVRISSGFLGFRSLTLRLTPETTIVVGDKEGGFGDIRPGERIVVGYTRRRGVLEARRIEVAQAPP